MSGDQGSAGVGARAPEAVAHVPEADTFHLGNTLAQLRRAVYSHLLLVLTTTVMSVAAVSFYLWIWPDTWQAEVMIAVDAESDQQRAAFYQGWNVFRREALVDEGTLMTSPPVLRDVVHKLDLRYEDMYHPFTSYATHLWLQSWIGKRYREIKSLLLGKKASVIPAEQIEFYRVMNDFSAGVNVTQIGEASIGLLVVKGSNFRVAEMANTIVDVYLDRRRERYVSEARQAYDSLKVETERIERQLAELDVKVREFRAKSGSVLLFEKDRIEVGQVLSLRMAIGELEAKIVEHEATLKVLTRQIARESGGLRADRLFRQEAAKDRLSKLEPLLAAAREKYQSGAPEIADLERQVAAAQRELSAGTNPAVVRDSARVSDSFEVLTAKHRTTEANLAGFKAALVAKRAEYKRAKRLLDEIPRKQQQHHEFERQQSLLEATHASLNAKLTQAAVSMATARSAPPAMRVVERASTPHKPKAPNTKLLLAASLLVGVLLGVLGALLLEVLSARVNRTRFVPGGNLRLFAVVENDPRFVSTIYGSRTEPAVTAR